MVQALSIFPRCTQEAEGRAHGAISSPAQIVTPPPVPHQIKKKGNFGGNYFFEVKSYHILLIVNINIQLVVGHQEMLSQSPPKLHTSAGFDGAILGGPTSNCLDAHISETK